MSARSWRGGHRTRTGRTPCPGSGEGHPGRRGGHRAGRCGTRADGAARHPGGRRRRPAGVRHLGGGHGDPGERPVDARLRPDVRHRLRPGGGLQLPLQRVGWQATARPGHSRHPPASRPPRAAPRRRADQGGGRRAGGRWGGNPAGDRELPGQHQPQSRKIPRADRGGAQETSGRLQGDLAGGPARQGHHRLPRRSPGPLGPARHRRDQPATDHHQAGPADPGPTTRRARPSRPRRTPAAGACGSSTCPNPNPARCPTVASTSSPPTPTTT